MFAPDTYYEPQISLWEAQGEAEFLKETIETICKNIAKHSEATQFSEIYQLLEEHIKDNIEKYKKELPYELN